ncbi:PREDICTED: probable protein phosphatase 2C 23 [Fragaria vesca subsp. vesca]|uniref:probable protein phosphatase 2C 23 n=1 Tax=Fragaria vesca subsp. vesca TaxID=101020 RepID=UPI0002C330E1|nr:PREDICTED: probable protein phosphatase 2C 23 [Fragaria vesca subsp. vesca]
MGNGVGKIAHCCSITGDISRRHDIDVDVVSPDEGLGHSFCYIRPETIISPTTSFEASSDEFTNPATTTFRSISGASVSANTFTPLSTTLYDLYPDSSGVLDRAARFESSTSFASIPLQPVPRNSGCPGSGSAERGFLSGPIERGFLSGPIDRLVCSGPIEKQSEKFDRSLSFGLEKKQKRRNLMRRIRRAIFKAMNRRHKSAVTPKEMESEKISGELNTSSTNLSSNASLGGNENGSEDFSMESKNLQWAQGKAGEDRVHVVVSDEHGWVFVGIYDGFNGPDAPDYLLSNLYSAVHEELKGLLWSDIESTDLKSSEIGFIEGVDKENCGVENVLSNRKQSQHLRNERNEMDNKWEESQKRWKCEWDREMPELDKENLKLKVSNGVAAANPSDVLKALSEALRKTEEAYLDAADKMVTENPELALMGSCVLVMLMKGDDVYLMNVGDSRAVLARKADHKIKRNLERINEEALCERRSSNADELYSLNNLTSVQLTMDHSTNVKEEVQRIRNEHPDDASAVMNKRVKGYLKVTRAFGAGFLKQPKWNDALLEMFRLNYVGTAPYITCIPSLYHHKLRPRDRLLILSSDGLYQYFTNEEAVSEVEFFISSFPDGDPAQHLIEEVLFRAAKKAGLAFHELLDIPQGERRRYHDDISIIIISLEGRIWRSSL